MSVEEIMSMEQFKNIVLESDKKYIFVDFYASWCGPCKRIAPKIDEYSEKYKKIKFCKLDIDNVPELADEYNITSLPTFLVFDQNCLESKHERIKGCDEEKIEKKLNQLIDFEISDDF